MMTHISTWRWLLGLAALAALAASGCSRQCYRRKADAEVYRLVRQKSDDPRWQLQDYCIEPSPISRMFDPHNPDCPAMPPDDPAAHELMRCVDGKCGSKKWERYGRTPDVENPCWMRHLPRDEKDEVVVDRPMAMQIALVNSREYQRELENLYLSALDVSFQRFRFDTQFFLTNSTFYTNVGPERQGGPSRELRSDTNFGFEKLFASGGQLVVELANSLVWQFAGPDEREARSLLDFSLVQPLLRGAGRAVVLENLTDSERALLANVRQMERFRHGFYTQVIAGRTAGPGPARGGLAVETLFPSAPGATGGIYGLLSDQVRIRNQRINVAGLRDSLDLIEAHYDAGRIDRLQLDVTRQGLLNAQSRLLTLETTYQDRLDAYKLLLGLPPCLDVKLDDPMLKRLNLVDPALTAIDIAVSSLIDELRDRDRKPDIEYRERVAKLAEQIIQINEILAEDRATLNEALPKRRQVLEQLAKRPEVGTGDVDPRPYEVAALDKRVTDLEADFEKMFAVVKKTAADLEAYGDQPAGAAPPPLLPLLLDTSQQILAAELIEAAARLDSITLIDVELGPREAYRIACQHRLDWMNARAALVDAWRQIEVRANALRADLDVVLSGDVSTVDNNPLRFRGSTGRLRVGFQFDAPLTRLIERNLYREALINYQRARRAYYTYEDRVSANLRSTLRALRQTQLDFELRRAGVFVAISQVEIARERLGQPPKPAAGQATTTFGATTARDVVQAYQALISAQDSLVTAWIEYEADRLNLDYELGTMQLDSCGLWVDPGKITSDGDEEPTEATDPADPAEPAQPRAPEPEAVPLGALLQLPEDWTNDEAPLPPSQ